MVTLWNTDGLPQIKWKSQIDAHLFGARKCMLDSKLEARDRKVRAAHTCWDKAARPPLHMGPQSRGELMAGKVPCRKDDQSHPRFQEDRWGAKITGHWRWQWEGQERGSPVGWCVFSQNTQKPGHHLEEGGSREGWRFIGRLPLKFSNFS